MFIFLLLLIFQLLLSVPVFVLAQCNIDANCWMYSMGCTLSGAIPFERKTPISCDNCTSACLKRRQGQIPYLCRSAVYDITYQTCDLFAVGVSSEYRLTPCPGRVFLCPTGNSQCGAAPVASTAAPIQDCGAGQTAVMVIFKDSQTAVSGGPSFAAASQDECISFCQKNQDKTGNSAPCKTALFMGGNCQLSPSPPLANAAGSVSPSPGAYYIEKQCLITDCKTILMDPKHIIVGFNKKTIDAATYGQCLQACLDAQKNYGFQCGSGQFFSDTQTQNCVINSETAATQPDKYTTVTDPVTYFEPKCAGGGGAGGAAAGGPPVGGAPAGGGPPPGGAAGQPPMTGNTSLFDSIAKRFHKNFKAMQLKAMSLKDAPMEGIKMSSEAGQWGQWTSCINRTFKTRYILCKNCLVPDSETRPCSHQLNELPERSRNRSN